MFDFEEKRRLKRIFYSRPAIVVLALLVLFSGKALWNVHQKYVTSRENAERVAKERDELLKREEFLKSEVERLQSDRGIEEELRQKFSVVRDGEEVAVIVDEPAPPAVPAPEPKKSLWQRFLGWFR
jgi:cell division protein FtsB